jgi:hypothetical protein
MSRLRLTSQRFLFLRLLSLSLFLGALYDLSFAALMVLAPQLPARILGLPLPGEAFYLWLMAIFLLMLAGLYILAAREPRRYSAVILVAIGGRFLGAVAFAVAAYGNPDLSGLYPLAAADLLFAIAHAGFWGPIRS